MQTFRSSTKQEKRDQHDVSTIKEIVHSMVNLFDYEQEKLAQIYSGVITSCEVASDLEMARTISENAFYHWLVIDSKKEE